MRFRQPNRGRLFRNLSAVIGAIAAPLIGQSVSAGSPNVLQVCVLAMIGGCVGVYFNKCISSVLRCVREGRSRSLLLRMCALGTVGGLVFLLCRTFASGTEDAYWAWIVSGSPWQVFVRGCCFGVVGAIMDTTELAPATDAGPAKGEQALS